MIVFKTGCGAASTVKSTSTSTLFHKTIGYNRLARKIAIANLGGPIKRKINWKEKKGKEKEGKLQFKVTINNILSQFYFNYIKSEQANKQIL